MPAAEVIGIKGAPAREAPLIDRGGIGGDIRVAAGTVKGLTNRGSRVSSSSTLQGYNFRCASQATQRGLCGYSHGGILQGEQVEVGASVALLADDEAFRYKPGDGAREGAFSESAFLGQCTEVGIDFAALFVGVAEQEEKCELRPARHGGVANEAEASKCAHWIIPSAPARPWPRSALHWCAAPGCRRLPGPPLHDGGPAALYFPHAGVNAVAGSFSHPQIVHQGGPRPELCVRVVRIPW